MEKNIYFPPFFFAYPRDLRIRHSSKLLRSTVLAFKTWLPNAWAEYIFFKKKIIFLCLSSLPVLVAVDSLGRKFFHVTGLVRCTRAFD